MRNSGFKTKAFLFDDDEEEMTSRKRGGTNKRRRNVHSEESESDSSEESMDFSCSIQKLSDQRLNNNWGQCPYCPKDGFKNVNVHIGHMHKCKNCKKLCFECKCSKNDINEPIRRYQSTHRYI